MIKCHALLVFSVVVISLEARAADDYVLGPDSQFKPEVPHGRVERFQFTNSTMFPGTVRDGGVYIPAQYDTAKPAAFMVFQDNSVDMSTNGSWLGTVWFDNLIARKALPVTVATFCDPRICRDLGNV